MARRPATVRCSIVKGRELTAPQRDSKFEHIHRSMCTEAVFELRLIPSEFHFDAGYILPLRCSGHALLMQSIAGWVFCGGVCKVVDRLIMLDAAYSGNAIACLKKYFPAGDPI